MLRAGSGPWDALGSAGGVPRDGCWAHGHVSFCTDSLEVEEAQVFYLNSNHHRLFWEDLAVEVWRLHGFPEWFIPTIHPLIRLESIPAF